MCENSTMSSPDDEVEEALPGLYGLPYEMMQHIFKFMDKNDLVQRCRLVCKYWKDLSTEICRQRFVKLVYWEYKGEHQRQKVFTLFDMDNPLWSSLDIVNRSSARDEAFQFAVLQFFGKSIFELTLYENDQAVVQTALSLAPNLRKILCSIRNWCWTPRTVPEEGEQKTSLKKLKQLTIYQLRDDNVEFLNYLVLGCGVRLDYFKSSLRITESKSAEMVASLLGNVRYIALKNVQCLWLPLPEFKALPSSLQKLSIKEIQLDFGEFDKWVSQAPGINFGIAEHFIALHAQRLKKLKLVIYSNNSGSQSSVPFNFPPLLPTLTTFSINIRYYRGTTSSNFGDRFLALLNPSQFPVLEKVSVVDNRRPSRTVNPNAFAFFPLTCHFHSVSKLKLSECSSTDDWGQLFPNLTSLYLHTSIDHDKVLVNCFSWNKLAHLTLHILPENGVLVNSLLSGIPCPEAVYGSSEDVIKGFRGPSILQLTNLKSLYVYVGDRNGILSDAGAGLSLLQIQPLDLTIFISQISEECKTKLKAHHRTFKLYLY